jgi:hypothetical protein
MWRLRFYPGIETSDGRFSRHMAAALARLQEASMLGRKGHTAATIPLLTNVRR